jgi:hypothetical protein
MLKYGKGAHNSMLRPPYYLFPTFVHNKRASTYARKLFQNRKLF